MLSRCTIWNCALVFAGVPAVQAQDTIPLDQFLLPESLEISIWAKSPQFHNPSNLDIDARGRIWVAEAVNYRGFKEHKKDSL